MQPTHDASRSCAMSSTRWRELYAIVGVTTNALRNGTTCIISKMANTKWWVLAVYNTVFWGRMGNKWGSSGQLKVLIKLSALFVRLNRLKNFTNYLIFVVYIYVRHVSSLHMQASSKLPTASRPFFSLSTHTIWHSQKWSAGNARNVATFSAWLSLTRREKRMASAQLAMTARPPPQPRNVSRSRRSRL